MTTQLSIDFPAPSPETSAQLEIAETGTNMAFRLSFRVPEFSPKGKLAGFHLEHAALSNVVSKEDLIGFFHGAQKFMDSHIGQDFIVRARAALAKRFNLTDEQAEMMQYTGYCTAEHRPCTKVDAHDSRWI